MDTQIRRKDDGTVVQLVTTYNSGASRARRGVRLPINVTCPVCEARNGERCVDDNVHPPREMDLCHPERK